MGRQTQLQLQLQFKLSSFWEMVTLKTLLGGRSEVHYECMYTKHKTQKRKVWHDGFLSLSATHKLVLFEEMPPTGAAMASYCHSH